MTENTAKPTIHRRRAIGGRVLRDALGATLRAKVSEIEKGAGDKPTYVRFKTATPVKSLTEAADTLTIAGWLAAVDSESPLTVVVRLHPVAQVEQEHASVEALEGAMAAGEAAQAEALEGTEIAEVEAALDDLEITLVDPAAAKEVALTDAQCAALDKLAANGELRSGNGTHLGTVRVLARLGLVVLTENGEGDWSAVAPTE
jgi:hypothetical protein